LIYFYLSLRQNHPRVIEDSTGILVWRCLKEIPALPFVTALIPLFRKCERCRLATRAREFARSERLEINRLINRRELDLHVSQSLLDNSPVESATFGCSDIDFRNILILARFNTCLQCAQKGVTSPRQRATRTYVRLLQMPNQQRPRSSSATIAQDEKTNRRCDSSLISFDPCHRLCRVCMTMQP